MKHLPSLRDSGAFTKSPSVETLGLDMLSPAGTGADWLLALYPPWHPLTPGDGFECNGLTSLIVPIDSPASQEQATDMKRTILIFLLACTSAFGQKFHDVSVKGSPVSLVVGHDYADLGPYAAARNTSNRSILAMVAVIRATGEYGPVVPCFSNMDYAFKAGVWAPGEERFACPMDRAYESAKVIGVDGAVLFVQFADGTTWGDPAAGRKLLSERPRKLGFLKYLVETYEENGEEAFTAALNDARLRLPERVVAGCLKSDAKSEKIATIDLANKRLAAAQEWHAAGIF